MTMATQDDIVRVAKVIAAGDQHPDMGALDGFTEDEGRQVVSLALYQIRYGPRRRAQRKARQLFQSWLTPAQREEYRRRGEVRIVGSAGGHYRIHPNAGRAERIERHGKNWYAVSDFCYHDQDCELPNADLALVHFLMLLTDEPGFLAVANEHPRDRQMWNGEYLRRMRRAQRERQEAA